MTDLFLDPRVMDYSGDRYQLVLLTLRWARQLKARGDPAPMQELVEKALKDLVEKRVTPEEIMSVKAVAEAPAPSPGVIAAAVVDEKEVPAKSGSNGSAKKTKTKKKK